MDDLSYDPELNEVDVEEKLESPFDLDEKEIIEKMSYLIHETDYFNLGIKNEHINIFLFYMTNKRMENYKKITVPLQKNKLVKDNLISVILKNKNVAINTILLVFISTILTLKRINWQISFRTMTNTISFNP